MLARTIFFLFVLLLCVPSHAASVTGSMRVAAEGQKVRLRLALSEPLATAPTSFALGNPMRIAVDLDNASSVRRSAEGTGAMQSVRVAQFDPHVVRIVVDLARPMQLERAHMDGKVLEIWFQPVSDAEFQRQVKLGRRQVQGFIPRANLQQDSAARLAALEDVIDTASRPIGKDIGKDAATVQPIVSAKPRARTPGVIVLDAGHGGKDPGAPIVTGGHEKNVTLAIVQAAKAEIERRARAKKMPVTVYLTRSDDRFITLGGRVALARKWKGDLFISVHADSAANQQARGASVYTLSDTASDKEAARLAAKENRADLIAGVDLSEENREVANLLIDLGMRDSMNASADFAEQLQRAMEPHGVLFRSHFHRFAGFQVLRNLGVPAVLLETGYVSNREDAEYLKSAKGQMAIARGIAEAAISYVEGLR